MKFSGFSSAVTLSVVLSMGSQSAFANPSECLDPSTLDPSQPLYEHQVMPQESIHWDIEYFNTYKLLHNLAAKETYLLYPCGTEVPEVSDDTEITASIPIPLQGAGLSVTTQIPFLELLGARTEISHYLGTTKYISSPCLRDLAEAGAVTEILDPSNSTYMDLIGIESGDLTAIIGNSGSEDILIDRKVRISVTEEDPIMAIFDWIKYYSALFNLEEKANQVFEDTMDRYTCLKENAAKIESTSDEPRLTVVWGNYDAFCGGWRIGSCPEYYCELVETCSADIIDYQGPKSIKGTGFCEGVSLLTAEEFVAAAKDADIWLAPTYDAENTLTEYADLLKDFKSVKAEQVYDYLGQGASAWFEQRIAEPGKRIFLHFNG